MYKVNGQVLEAIEDDSTLGQLFEYMADETALTTYVHRPLDFLSGLFLVSFQPLSAISKSMRNFSPIGMLYPRP